jgi:CHAD domain-containing protein
VSRKAELASIPARTCFAPGFSDSGKMTSVTDSPEQGTEAVFTAEQRESVPFFEALKKLLAERLSAVAQLLPLAATRWSENVEQMHQLRVSIRRSLVVLRLLRNLLPRKAADRVRKQLRMIRVASGEARDLDVFIGRLRRKWGPVNGPWDTGLIGLREKAQQPVEKVWQVLEEGAALNHRIRQLSEAVERRSSQTSWGPAALPDAITLELQRGVARFFKMLQGDLRSEKRQHRLRKRVRNLRYSLELLPSGQPGGALAELQSMLDAVQKLLGDIRDSSLAIGFLRQCEGMKQEHQYSAQFRHRRKLEKQRKRRLQKRLDDWLADRTPISELA